MESEDFERLLKVCRLRLADKEKDRIKKDIDEIINYFNTIDSVDCDKYHPSYHPVDILPKKRPDKIEPFHEAGKILKNSKIYRFYIVGPKI